MSRSFYGRTGIEFTNTLADGLAKVAKTVRPRAVNAVLQGAQLIRDRAHDLANVSPRVVGHAVDGGHMRDRIDITLIETAESVTARIGIDLGNVPYAAHQEFGARGKPFLRPAIDESRDEVHEIMRESFADTELVGKTAVRFRRIA